MGLLQRSSNAVGGCRGREVGGESVQGSPREGPPDARRDAGDAVIDPDDPAGMKRVGLFAGTDDFGLRILHPGLPARSHGRGAVENDGATGTQGLRERSVAIVPDDTHRAGSVIGDRLDAKETAAHAGGTNAAQPNEERRRLSGRESRDGPVPTPILVTERQSKQELP